MKLISFYLPQFHPVKENSEWWGPGFTEWTNVAKAKPNFVGHQQPHVPRDLGFYDLRNVETMREQAQLAKLFGVHGFCFYYYWFSGRRILEVPLDNWTKSDIDFPFCICWANENWTKRWDGGQGEVLLAQNHTEDDFRAFFRSITPILRDPRYITVDGKPILLVYRPTLFPDSEAACAIWRDEAQKAGFTGIHLCTVQFYGITDPRPLGFDSAVEFPPHQFLGGENVAEGIKITNKEFRGALFDYRKIVAQSLERPKPDYILYRGIVPSWDNTARRQNDPVTLTHSTPANFHYWLSRLIRWSRENLAPENQLLFINAWNEWGEGCHLEPDLENKTRYLEACLAALTNRASDMELVNAAVKTEDGRTEIIASQYPFYDKAVADEMLASAARRKSIRYRILDSYERLRGTSPILFRIVRFVFHSVRFVYRLIKQCLYMTRSMLSSEKR